jgi:hypothetical protein
MRIIFFLIFLIGDFMENANAEPIFKLASPSMLTIDGSAMKALKIASDEFVASGRDMREFHITISIETDKNKNDAEAIFIVTFMGKLTPGKRGLGTANRVPGSVTYFISREEWEIIKEQGVK